MKKLFSLLALLALAACATPSGKNDTAGDYLEDDAPVVKPEYKATKVGKAYTVNGKQYQPQHDTRYNKVGLASWYGPGFHGKKTANGERYNQNGFTAAHPTLPLPSIVRVTNLANGKAINVRVNDRGPFHSDRIIDLSRAAAEKLEVKATGVAKVRVQYLQDETEQYIASRGKQGDEPRYSTDFAVYEGVSAVPEKQVALREFDGPEIESHGNQESAPVQAVKVASVAAVSPSAVTMDLPTSKVTEAASGTALIDNRPWVIQVASYADRVNAEKLMKQLLGMGQASVQQAQVQGASFYRVMLAPQNPQNDRFEMLSQLEQRFGIDDAKVIVQ